MALIDFILNIAGLLLWLSWRSIRLDPYARVTPATLAGTIRRAEPPKLKRWHFLAALAALLLVRGIFYWEIGTVSTWTPKLDLLFVAPAFPVHFFLPMLLFSVLGFVRILAGFYFWLLFLAMINRGNMASDSIQKVISLQLGRAAHWPKSVQAVAPVLGVMALWIVLHPLLFQAGVTNRAQSVSHLAAQGMLVGASLYFSLKFLLPAFLFANLVASYVYLGAGPLWDFINGTARNIMAPLNRLPLRWGKVDFRPILCLAVILALLHVLPNLLFSQLSRRGLVLWPQ